MERRLRGLGQSMGKLKLIARKIRLIAKVISPELFWIIRLAPMSSKPAKEVAPVPVPATTTQPQPTFEIIHNYRQNNNNYQPAPNADPNSALGAYPPSVRRTKKERRGKKYSRASQQKREIGTRFVGLAGNSCQGDQQQASLWRHLWKPELEGFQREGELELLAIFGWAPNSQQPTDLLFPQQEEQRRMSPSSSGHPPAERNSGVGPPAPLAVPKNDLEADVFEYAAIEYQYDFESYHQRNQESEDLFFPNFPPNDGGGLN